MEQKKWYDHLKLASHDFLYENDVRVLCPSCGCSRSFFCYECFILVGNTEGIPSLTLPIDVNLIYWKKEYKSKSTGFHAKLLAEGNTNFYTYPDMPDFDPEKTVILFPADDSVPVEEFDRWGDVTQVLFVEAQWHSTKKVLKNPAFANIPKIQIHNYETKFWRYQTTEPSTYLATIEAIYYFLVEYHKAHINPEYDGEYDNLLFFYTYLYDKVKKNYIVPVTEGRRITHFNT